MYARQPGRVSRVSILRPTARTSRTTGAAELGVDPADCFVIEDAASGIQAAKAGGMAALGVARVGDEDELAAERADLVVTSLDEIDVAALGRHTLALRTS
jgi:beta-phosphoglucomutase